MFVPLFKKKNLSFFHPPSLELVLLSGYFDRVNLVLQPCVCCFDFVFVPQKSLVGHPGVGETFVHAAMFVCMPAMSLPFRQLHCSFRAFSDTRV